MTAKKSSLLNPISCPRACFQHPYILGDHCRQHPHHDRYAGLVEVGDFPAFDDVGGEDVDDQDHDEDEGFDVEGIGRHASDYYRFNMSSHRMQKNSS